MFEGHPDDVRLSRARISGLVLLAQIDGECSLRSHQQNRQIQFKAASILLADPMATAAI